MENLSNIGVIRDLLERAGVPAGARAEQLTLEQFAAVSRALAEEP